MNTSKGCGFSGGSFESQDTIFHAFFPSPVMTGNLQMGFSVRGGDME